MTRFEQLYGIPLAKRRRMEILIALMALEIIFAFSYLGFIIIPLISITTMHLLVMIAAMILGTRESVAVSLVFAEWVDALPLSFFKTSRKVVDELRQRYPELGGHIYCHNHFSLRWARFLGFKIDPAQPYGPKQELFHRFYTEVNPDVS